MRTLLTSIVVGLAVQTAAAQEWYKSEPGRYAVVQEDLDWHDAARCRDVPVRVYAAQGGGGPAAQSHGEQPAPPAAVAPAIKFPVIVFSHGLGGSRANYGYVCEHLASQGYLVIVPTHHGSDT